MGVFAAKCTVPLCSGHRQLLGEGSLPLCSTGYVQLEEGCCILVSPDLVNTGSSSYTSALLLSMSLPGN